MFKILCNHNYSILEQHKQLSMAELVINSNSECRGMEMHPGVVLTIYKCCKCDNVKESKVVLR